MMVLLSCPESFMVCLHWSFPVKIVQIHQPSRLPVGSRTCCWRESSGNWLVCLCFQLVLHSSVGFNFWNMQHFFSVFGGSCVGFSLLLFFFPKEMLKWECKSAAFPPLCAANPSFSHFFSPMSLLLLESRTAEHGEGWLCCMSWSVINTTL